MLPTRDAERGRGDEVLDDDAVLEHRDLGVPRARVRRLGAHPVAHHHHPFDGLAAGQELGLGQDRRTATAGVAAVPAALPLGLQPGRAVDALDLVVLCRSAAVAGLAAARRAARAPRCWAGRRATRLRRCRRRPGLATAAPAAAAVAAVRRAVSRRRRRPSSESSSESWSSIGVVDVGRRSSPSPWPSDPPCSPRPRPRPRRPRRRRRFAGRSACSSSSSSDRRHRRRRQSSSSSSASSSLHLDLRPRPAAARRTAACSAARSIGVLRRPPTRVRLRSGSAGSGASPAADVREDFRGRGEQQVADPDRVLAVHAGLRVRTRPSSCGQRVQHLAWWCSQRPGELMDPQAVRQVLVLGRLF